MKIAGIILFTWFLLLQISCQEIETGNTLDKKTIAFIENLGLLDKDEKIIKFYSNHTKKTAGNFYTDKRIAHYWLDQHDSSKTDVSFSFYQDIISIDTLFNVYGDFTIPYMTIKKKDSSEFKVYIDGTHEQEKAFFEGAINTWKKQKL